MAVLINETMASAPTTLGTATNTSPAWNVGGYYTLTTDVNQYTDLYTTGNVTTDFDSYVDMQMGVTNGADSCWLYWGWNTHPQTENDSTNAGYLVERNDFSNFIAIHWAGSTLTSTTYTKDTSFDRLEVLFNAGVFTIKYKGSTVISYTDTSWPRTYPGTEFGCGARCGGSGNTHNIQNLFWQTVGGGANRFQHLPLLGVG